MNNSLFKRKNYRFCTGLWILVSGKKGVAMANVEYKVIKGAEKDAEPLLDETEEQYQERVAVLCLNELFVRTQLPLWWLLGSSVLERGSLKGCG